MKRRVVHVPSVKKAQLLQAFERMCKALGKTSRGFDVEAIDAQDQWAMKYTPKCGWMIVCGLGGCGVPLGRWNAYVQTRWNFLMLLEAVETACRP
jgi:hypothetical protein